MACFALVRVPGGQFTAVVAATMGGWESALAPLAYTHQSSRDKTRAFWLAPPTIFDISSCGRVVHICRANVRWLAKMRCSSTNTRGAFVARNKLLKRKRSSIPREARSHDSGLRGFSIAEPGTTRARCRTCTCTHATTVSYRLEDNLMRVNRRRRRNVVGNATGNTHRHALGISGPRRPAVVPGIDRSPHPGARRDRRTYQYP